MEKKQINSNSLMELKLNYTICYFDLIHEKKLRFSTTITHLIIVHEGIHLFPLLKNVDIISHPVSASVSTIFSLEQF